MAQVDFTLEDIRGIVGEEVRTGLRTVVREEIVAVVTPIIEASELRITTTVAATFAEYEAKYDARNMSLRRVVDQHSKEIMEPGARAA